MWKIKQLCKRALAFVLALTMLSLPQGVFANPELGEIYVYFNGQRMEFDQPPIIVNDRTMVPFRAIFEAFGAEVEWNQEYRRVMAHHEQVGSVALFIGQETGFVNWVPFELDAAPFVTHDTERTLVPIRFVSESLGAAVEWDDYNRNVIITTNEMPYVPEIPEWETYTGGSGVLEVEYFFDVYDWSVWPRNEIRGIFYYNTRGWQMSVNTYREMIAERDRIIAQIIRPGMSDFEILRTVHYWLVSNVSYNHDVWSWERQRATGDGWNPHFRHVRYEFEHQFAWSALVLRTTVCAGYTDALIYLLEPFGIEAIYVYGPTADVSHAWNMVRLGGNWYHVDTTWNRMENNGHPLVIYDWFMISDSALRSQGGSNNWSASSTWQAAGSPVAPRTRSFDRPTVLWDHNLGRWRNRTAQDDMSFNITASSNIQGAGNVTVNPSSSRPGQWVVVNAHANQGYRFERWEIVSGGITFHSQSGAWATFVMPANNVSIRAVFTQTHQTGNVSVSVSNTQAGTASANPHANVLQGNWVSLQAHANPGFEFEHWEVVQGNFSITSPHSATTGFAMPAGNASVRAIFRQAGQQGTVTTSVNNAQWGTATANPNTNVAAGQWVNLQAHANSGLEFDRWEIVSGTAQIQNINSSSTGFSMPQGAVSVRAVFRQVAQDQRFALNLTVNNTAAGTASASVTTNIVAGGIIMLNVNPNHGFEFSHWEIVSGGGTLHDPFPNSTTREFTMPASNVTLRAVFREQAQQRHSVTVSVNNTQAGEAWVNQGTNVLPGTNMTMHANPWLGFEFERWEVVSGSVSIQNPTSADNASFVMPSSNVSIRAIFRTAQTFSVTVTASGGTATASPNSGLLGGGWETVSLQAQPNPGFEFSHWEVLSGGIPTPDGWFATFQMPSNNVSVRAVFRELLTLTATPNDPSRGTVFTTWATELREGDRVYVSAMPNFGFEFSHWEVISGNPSISNPSSPDIGISMPSSNVSLRAVFVPN